MTGLIIIIVGAAVAVAVGVVALARASREADEYLRRMYEAQGADDEGDLRWDVE